MSTALMSTDIKHFQSYGMLLSTYSISALLKAKKPEVQPIKWIQVILRLPFSPGGFYEGIFH